MHSSRMRTVRTGSRLPGGVRFPGVCVLPEGVCFLGGCASQGVCFLGGVLPRGCVCCLEGASRGWGCGIPACTEAPPL